MTAKQLILILSTLPSDTQVMIEYMPRPHEYITECVLGVRASEGIAVIMGMTDSFD